MRPSELFLTRHAPCHVPVHLGVGFNWLYGNSSELLTLIFGCSQGPALGTTEGIGLFKWGHMQEQRVLSGNKRSGIKLETNGVVLSMEIVKSSSVESAKGVEVEPKFTCACSSSSTQHPAMKRCWEERGFGWCYLFNPPWLIGEKLLFRG